MLDDGVFQVRSTGGDSALGGDDMDRALAHELLADLGFDETRQTPQLVRLVLDEARKAKHALTTQRLGRRRGAGGTSPSPSRAPASTSSSARCSSARASPAVALSRTRGSSPTQLDGVILVGGSTRVPAVRDVRRGALRQAARSADIDPDQVVALGAAVQADLLAGEGQKDEVLLLDVIPLSLGIEVGGGVVDKILPRNSTIPCSAKATYTTQEDRQTGFEIHVVQGEREMVADNRSLARFTLKGIPPMPAGMARLEVTFHVDADGLLGVHAQAR